MRKHILQLVYLWRGKTKWIYGIGKNYYIQRMPNYAGSYVFDSLDELIEKYNKLYSTNVKIEDVEKFLILE